MENSEIIEKLYPYQEDAGGFKKAHTLSKRIAAEEILDKLDDFFENEFEFGKYCSFLVSSNAVGHIHFLSEKLLEDFKKSLIKQ